MTAIIVNLLPVVMVIGLWVFFMGRMRKATPALEAQLAYMAAHLEETKQINLKLERIAAALEGRQASQ